MILARVSFEQFYGMNYRQGDQVSYSVPDDICGWRKAECHACKACLVLHEGNSVFWSPVGGADLGYS